MAVHRTREQKIKATQRLAQLAQSPSEETNSGGYSFSGQDLKKPATPVFTQTQLSHHQTVLNDLMKTVMISVILTAIVVGIYFYLRYN
ncbi:MAG: hypothetical protein COY81_02325 [Candidatus Pacebacteria bacterium CG_4_10_14_0_8_um_filter_43_12]|nr:MAG: hypothetical protein COU66_01045 [Candidatus Pacebacteria bacterium CG10_big_fil_rev_8_21_14_0_10_44_11]PIY79483.1 MAG: hypothetical protein COY81_02325 [Candidatus Pacebacteria bacterium CG_4_10_14_0_8_um_filter_43_12]